MEFSITRLKSFKGGKLCATLDGTVRHDRSNFPHFSWIIHRLWSATSRLQTRQAFSPVRFVYRNQKLFELINCERKSSALLCKQPPSRLWMATKSSFCRYAVRKSDFPSRFSFTVIALPHPLLLASKAIEFFPLTRQEGRKTFFAFAFALTMKRSRFVAWTINRWQLKRDKRLRMNRLRNNQKDASHKR